MFAEAHPLYWYSVYRFHSRLSGFSSFFKTNRYCRSPFWGAYFWRGLSMEGNLRFKIDWASLRLRANGRNNSQQCWELLANNVASVCTGLKVWPFSNFTHKQKKNSVDEASRDFSWDMDKTLWKNLNFSTYCFYSLENRFSWPILAKMKRSKNGQFWTKTMD